MNGADLENPFRGVRIRGGNGGIKERMLQYKIDKTRGRKGQGLRKAKEGNVAVVLWLRRAYQAVDQT